MGRDKPVRTQKRANLIFSPARVKRILRKVLGNVRMSKNVQFTVASVVETVMDSWVTEAKRQMSDKASKYLRPRHCAIALADPKTEFYGIFPTMVAGEYVNK